LKTFAVKTENGLVEYEQLATFTHSFGTGSRQVFRFVVTRQNQFDQVCVTHRASTKRVCEIPYSVWTAYLGDTKAAGKRALDLLAQRVGSEKIINVLNAAEREC
jgi:hypothetical protein